MNRMSITNQPEAKIAQIKVIDKDLILQSLSDGVCVVGADRKISFVNRSAAHLLGYKITDILEIEYDLVFFQRDKSLSEYQLATCPIQFALTEGAASHINAENFFRADGSAILVEYVCSPIFEESQIIGAVVTFQDISERRDIESAIAEARDAALEATRAKAAFLANMSHEIRTPLSGIIGTANLLLDTDLNDEQKKYLQMLQKSVDLLMETVNDILDFSKIEAGKLSLETLEFNLTELVEETVNLFKASANKKSLALNLSLNSDFSENLRGDANRLRQVLNNLLSNAIKFTSAGEIRLEVSKKEKNDSQIIVLFEIFDTGIGIDDEEKNKLFQPFTQADVSTTRRFGGTGLGLAICREIVELMNGEIGVESEIGKGSRFWFTILLDNAEKKSENVDPINRKTAKEFEILKQKSEAIKILIAEDDEINREITSKLLEQLGYESEFAENGAEAIKKAFEGNFDLILMDCQMPEIDGFSATEAIRNFEIAKRPKIVALTAFSAESEREKCLRAGMNDYLCKPVTKKDLLAIIQRYFLREKVLLNLDLEEKFVQHSLSEIIHPETLKNFLAIESRGEKNFIAEILQIFCDNAENQLAGLQTDFENRDAASINRRAHSLKGSSANVGLENLAELFEKLQIQTDSENWQRIEDLLSEITEKFKFVKQKTLEI